MLFQDVVDQVHGDQRWNWTSGGWTVDELWFFLSFALKINNINFYNPLFDFLS